MAVIHEVDSRGVAELMKELEKSRPYLADIRQDEADWTRADRRFRMGLWLLLACCLAGAIWRVVQ